MWDQNGQERLARSSPLSPGVSNTERAEQRAEPATPERELAAGGVTAMRFPSGVPQLSDVEDEDAFDADPPGDTRDELWLRLRARRLIREFLRAVPRSEPEATLAIMRPDGVMRILTRAQLTTGIDRLRPRMRQIMRLAVEERWPRAKVCEYLHDISMKTFERDQMEALDLLTEL